MNTQTNNKQQHEHQTINNNNNNIRVKPIPRFVYDRHEHTRQHRPIDAPQPPSCWQTRRPRQCPRHRIAREIASVDCRLTARCAIVVHRLYVFATVSVDTTIYTPFNNTRQSQHKSKKKKNAHASVVVVDSMREKSRHARNRRRCHERCCQTDRPDRQTNRNCCEKMTTVSVIFLVCVFFGEITIRFFEHQLNNQQYI
jgi:hypothetical protein